MNIWFWLITAGMLLAALLILIFPFFNKKPLTNIDGEQRNLKIARQQVAELKRQLDDSNLTQAQYDAQYLELQQNLQFDLHELKNQEKPAGSQGRWMIGVLVLLVPMLSYLLYFQLGDANALKKAELQQQSRKDVENVRVMITKIIERLKQNPEDREGWLMLGRSYLYIQQYQQAAEVFAKILTFQPDNVEVLLNYANSLAMSGNGQLTGKPAELIYKALKLAPDNNTALWLGGMAKAEEGDSTAAEGYWRQLVTQLPADSAEAEQVKQMLAELSAQQVDSTPAEISTRININVEIADNLKPQVQAGQTVFIYAQALNGPKMPLAIVRKQVADLPLSVELNDSMAMQPGLHLADFPQLRIVARVSKNGDAMPKPGDLIGTQEFNVSAADKPVSITIDQDVK